MRTIWNNFRLFGPADEGTAGAAPADPAPGAAAAAAAAAAPPAGDAPPAAAPAAPPAGDAPPPAASAKWWEGLADHHKAYLTPKGLTVDDPLQALPKLIDIAANAEKRIGKGVDNIIDKPAKDQTYADWARANAEALRLPKDAAAYEVKPPADWPKNLPWDSAAEAAAREIAFKHAIPPEAHAAYVAFQADQLKAFDARADAELAAAREEMKTEVRRDWGDQTDARIGRAVQTMQTLAERAGMTEAHVQALSQTMSGATSDAAVVRLMDVVAEMMADDIAVGMGGGDKSFKMTPAEARKELAQFESAEGEYGKAYKEGNRVKLAELRARRDQLSRLAAQ